MENKIYIIKNNYGEIMFINSDELQDKEHIYSDSIYDTYNVSKEKSSKYSQYMAPMNDENSYEEANDEEINIEEIPNDIESVGLVLDLACKSNKKISIRCEELEQSEDKLKDDKKKYLRKLVNGYKRVVASALALCSIISVGFLGNTFAKEVSKNKGICNRKTLIYAQIDDEVKRMGLPHNYDVYYTGQSDKVLIKVYEPWDDNNIRNVKEYDISDVNVSKIEDYFDIDITNMESTSSKEKLNKYTIFPNEGGDTIKTVEINTYDREHIENETYENSLGLYYSIYAIFIVLTLVISFIDYRELGTLYFYIDDLKTLLNDFKEYKKTVDFDKQIKLINNKKEEILKEINQNDELRNKFLELYTTNMYLMNDPTEFKRRFDEVISEVDTINLRKELKK